MYRAETGKKDGALEASRARQVRIQAVDLEEKVFTQTQKMNEYCRIIELVCQDLMQCSDISQRLLQGWPRVNLLPGPGAEDRTSRSRSPRGSSGEPVCAASAESSSMEEGEEEEFEEDEEEEEMEEDSDEDMHKGAKSRRSTFAAVSTVLVMADLKANRM
eukprot:g4521.t1